MRKVLKWLAIALGGIVVIAVIVAIVLFASTTTRLNRRYSVAPEAVAVPTDTASIERGKHWATVYCVECHAEDLGGKVVFNQAPVGAVAGPNLTSGEGGIGSQYRDGDWVRAIRHGVGPDSKPFLVMPSADYYNFSDRDLGEIIAYAKSVRPVARRLAGDGLTAIGRMLVAAGVFGNIIDAERIPQSGPRPPSPPPAVTPAYGEYLVRTGGCRTCHGQDLDGGKSPNPSSPPAPSLVRLAGYWSDAQFIESMRHGLAPGETKPIDNEFMPWKTLGQMTDDELRSIFVYLHSLTR